MTGVIEKRLSLHRQLTNQKLQNDDLKSQLAQVQHLTNLGNATYMIAHEINNLLTPMASYAALALNNPDDRPLADKALQKAARNSERASKIMESLLAMATGQTQQKKNTSLITLVEDIFACLCRDFTKDRINVKILIPQDLSVYVVPVQIQQVLMNLILNAHEAMLPRGGTLTIKAQDSDDMVQIQVTDTGCGIEPDDLENIFEPFFTTKANKDSPSQHSGSGLGLVFCKKIIDAHNGSILVESIPDKATTFKIALPGQH